MRRLSSLEATERTASRCAPGMLEAAPSLFNISSFSLFNFMVASSLLASDDEKKRMNYLVSLEIHRKHSQTIFGSDVDDFTTGRGSPPPSATFSEDR